MAGIPLHDKPTTETLTDADSVVVDIAPVDAATFAVKRLTWARLKTLVKGFLGNSATRDVGTAANQVAIGNHGHSIFGASGNNHSAGFVPDPGAAAGATRYLREDGSFAVPSGGTGGSASEIAFATGAKAAVDAVGLKISTPQTNGDSSSTVLIDGYDGDNRTLHIGRSGAYFAKNSLIFGTFDDNGILTPAIYVYPNNRVDISSNLWVRGQLTLFSPSGVARQIGLSDSGTIAIPGAINNAGIAGQAPYWGANTHVFDALAPNGEVRSYVGGYGNLRINVTSPNGGANWDSTCPLDVNHDPITALTAPLARFSISGVEKAALKADGTFTGRGAIFTNSNSALPIVVLQAAPGQTANLQEWRDASGNLKSYIAPDGTFHVVGSGQQQANSTAASV